MVNQGNAGNSRTKMDWSDQISPWLAILLAIPVGFLALLVSGLSLWAFLVFFFQLFTKPNLMVGLGQLMICALGIWFVHSLVSSLLGKRGGWRVFFGLAAGFAALSPFAIDICRSLSGHGLHGKVRELRLGAEISVVVFGGWLATGLLLSKVFVGNMAAVIRQCA